MQVSIVFVAFPLRRTVSTTPMILCWCTLSNDLDLYDGIFPLVLPCDSCASHSRKYKLAQGSTNRYLWSLAMNIFRRCSVRVCIKHFLPLFLPLFSFLPCSGMLLSLGSSVFDFLPPAQVDTSPYFPLCFFTSTFLLIY